MHISRFTFSRIVWTCLPLLACIGCKAPSTPPSVVPVVVAQPAARVSSARDLRLSGTFAADRSISASFGTMGTVEQVLVNEGQTVRRGQVLARLSARSYQDALGIAKAKADQAEDAYRRLEPMFRNQTLPEVKMVEVETGREQARLSVSMARKSLDDTVLRAVEAGVVAKRHVEPGANVAPGVPVITLVQTKTLLATAPVPEAQVARIKKGDPARVVVTALGKTVDGVVREVAVLPDVLTRTYDVKVAVPNPAGELRVGMVVEVYLHMPGQGDALAVPPEAVRVDESGIPCAFVVRADRTLERRKLRVAGFVGEATAVAEGLSEGEMVVTSGTPMLAAGMTVRLMDQASGTGGRR